METPLHIPLSELLQELREEGFIIGVDSYLALDDLLKKLDTKSLRNPDLMRHFLCPLFATDKEQQESFYRIYDKLIAPHRPAEPVETMAAPIPAITLPVAKKAKARRDLLIFLGMIVVFIALIAAAWFIPWDEHTTLDHATSSIKKHSTGLLDLYTQYAPLKAGTAPKITKTEADSVSFLKMYSPPIASYEAGFMQRFHSPVMYGGLATLIILAGFFLLYEYYNWYRRRLIARMREGKTPPLSWPIEVDEKLPVDLPEAFYLLARSMRKRVSRGMPVLDVVNTVKASARLGGRLDFQFKEQSQPAEYLVLIDTGHGRDLLTSWFDFLFEKLGKNQVNLSVWYYNGDPHTCHNETHPDGVSLNYLQYHYGGHRMLFIGDGNLLLDAATGTLAPWTEVLKAWKNMALLTTRPVSEWGLNEFFLSENMLLLPANLEGIQEMSDHFENHNPDFVPYGFREKSAKPAPEANMTNEDTLRVLAAYFGFEKNATRARAMLQWLAACCLLPELYWNVTLYLGKHLPAYLPASAEGSAPLLLSLENLYDMAALPWFREGKVPDKVRQYFLEESGLLSPVARKELSAMLMRLLQQNQPADKAQLAYDYRNMQIVVLELMQNPEARRRQELLSQLKQLQSITRTREYLTLNFLRGKRGKLIDTILPAAMKSLLFREGLSFNGLRTGLKTAAVLAVSLFLYSQIDFNRLEGEVVDYSSKSYYVDSPYKKAALITFREDTLYNDRVTVNTPPVDEGTDYQELLYAVLADSDCTPALTDLYIYHYNAGVMYFKQKRYNDALEKWGKNIQIEQMIARSLKSPAMADRENVLAYYDRARAMQKKGLALLGR